jgi:2-amino-4-hydroxy-6-hydroxymethyldihydropteridine diphosphokinase
MITAYIALGSNLQNPPEQLRSALDAIDALPLSKRLRTSSFYRSEAVGPGDQPDYLNAVLALETQLPARELLRELQAIEQSRGRVREQRWAARTLDLDILLYGQQIINTPDLCIPHPRMSQRNFVLYPLLEIEGAELLLPDGRELGTLLASCPRGDLVLSQLRTGGK